MSIKRILISFILPLLLFCCSEVKHENKNVAEDISWTIDTVNIIHSVLPVTVPVRGYLESWKKETIVTEDSSRIITVLVEQGQKVKQGEFLLSLWAMDKNREYTPQDLRAPFAGIVERVFVNVGSKAGKNKPLLHMYNDDYYSVKVTMYPDQMAFLRKNQKVIQTTDTLQQEGFIESLDRKSNSIHILIKNNGLIPPATEMARMDIICGNVRGDFILSSEFDNSKLTAYIDDESSFEILPIAVSDSLSLISPGLPHLSHISVLSHNN